MYLCLLLEKEDEWSLANPKKLMVLLAREGDEKRIALSQRAKMKPDETHTGRKQSVKLHNMGGNNINFISP